MDEKPICVSSCLVLQSTPIYKNEFASFLGLVSSGSSSLPALLGVVVVVSVVAREEVETSPSFSQFLRRLYRVLRSTTGE